MEQSFIATWNCWHQVANRKLLDGGSKSHWPCFKQRP